MFIDELRHGCIDEAKRENYRNKFNSDATFRNKELEHILILIDRYIGIDKPPMLAKLYLAYLDEKIVWEEFTTYAEIIDRFLLFDYRTLISNTVKFNVYNNTGAETILRLVSLDLMVEDNSISLSQAKNK